MTEILNDWKFWGFVIQALITIGGFCIIKFNDFKHLTADVQELSTDVKANTAKLNKIDKKLAVSETKIANLEKSRKK